MTDASPFKGPPPASEGAIRRGVVPQGTTLPVAGDAQGLMGRAWGPEGPATEYQHAVEVLEGSEAAYLLTDQAEAMKALLSYGEA